MNAPKEALEQTASGEIPYWLRALLGWPLALLGGFVTFCFGMFLGIYVFSRIAGGHPQPWLFAESGLSLDRLRTLVEVGASGSIAKATGTDPVKQSQYSRQIKELEDFFRSRLIERYGKGIRLTSNGKELARISRFFLLGLSNFRRGCLREEQTFRIGACATVLQQFVIPVLTDRKGSLRFAVEVVDEDEIERRLHDLTLDFAIVSRADLSRPLQSKELGEAKLILWVPKSLGKTEDRARRAFKEHRLPLALPGLELHDSEWPALKGYAPQFACANFLQARAALEGNAFATLLPDFLQPEGSRKSLLRLPMAEMNMQFRLAWNPRLLRLNPIAERRRDLLIETIAAHVQSLSRA